MLEIQRLNLPLPGMCTCYYLQGLADDCAYAAREELAGC